MRSALAPLDQLTRPGRRTGRRAARRNDRRSERAERRRLQRLDALSAQLAELHSIREVLEEAAAIVRRGWVQGGWFSVSTPDGARGVTAYDMRVAVDAEVTGACLVGAVVEAAGGPATVRSQLVQRTLDLLWHSSRENPDRPVRWCPAPRIRMMQVLELTHWNDAPRRTQDEVVDFLLAARATADVQRDLVRLEQAALTDVGQPPGQRSLR